MADTILTPAPDAGVTQVITAPTWTEQLEGSLKGNEAFNQYQTISDFGKAFIELRGKTEGAVKIPGENATPEEITAFRKSLGVPEKSTDYKIEKGTPPEGMPYDEALETKFKETAHQLDLTPKQVQGLFKMFSDHNSTMFTEIAGALKDNREKAVNALKDIWKGDEFKTNTEKTVRSFLKFIEAAKPPEAFGGAEGVKKWFEEGGLGDDPVVVWFFSKIFDQISDDKFIGGAPSGSGPKTEPGMLDFPSMKPK
jgi:hypothetical protein